MRSDIFLSSLLFGITLLTCALAIMHLLGGAMLERTRMPPAARGKIRILLLGSTICISLLLFLVRLSSDISGYRLFSWRFDNVGADFFPRRVFSLEGDGRIPASKPQEFTTERSWTLYSKAPRELRAQKLQSELVTLSSAGVAVWSGADNGPLCRGWIERAKSLGIEPRVSQGVPALGAGALLIVCPSAVGDRASWERVRTHVYDGGSVLVVGMPLHDSAEAVQSLVRVGAFRTPDPALPLRVIVGGPRLEWGGFPSGLQIHLGGNPDSRRDMVLTEVGAGVGEAIGINEELDSVTPRDAVRLAALVMGEYGKGRVAWTGLPARVSGKTELMHGEAWDVLGQRVFAHLMQAPQVGLELWPMGEAAPVVIAVDGASNLNQLTSLSRMLHAKKASASNFLIMSEANERPRVVAGAQAAGDEIGIDDLDHADASNLDFYQRYDRQGRWLGQFDELPRSDGPGVNVDVGSKTVKGAMSVPGATTVADFYAAAMANRLEYSIIDPFGDQLSPMRVHLAKTAPLMRHLSEGKGITDAPSLRSLVLWPHRAMDDFALIRAAGGAGQDSELRRLVLAQYRHVSWAGGPYLLRASTMGLARDDRQSTLGRLIDTLRTEGATFPQARDLISYWETRSETDVVVDPVAPASLPTDLRREFGASDARDSDVEYDEGDEVVADAGVAPYRTEGGAARARPRVSRRIDEMAFRISVRNNSPHALKHAVLRVSEPSLYRAWARKTKVEDTRGDGLRVIRVPLPDLEAGESFTIWLERRPSEVE